MITTSCDLACPGCDRFIDFNHNWTEPYDIIEERMNVLSKKIQPDSITIIGGEPLIHPKIYDILRLTRKHFPDATIEVFTNGFLLEKRNQIFSVLQEIQPSKITVSIHNRQAKIRNTIFNNIESVFLNKAPWNKTAQWQFVYGGTELEIADEVNSSWYEYRRTIDGKQKPWNDNDPVSSYNACGVNIFPIVYNGRIYKCPPISMLETHAKKFDMLDDSDWKPYLEYKGYDITDELQEFVDNIFKPNKICGMCPANPVLKPQKDAIIKTVKYEV